MFSGGFKSDQWNEMGLSVVQNFWKILRRSDIITWFTSAYKSATRSSVKLKI